MRRKKSFTISQFPPLFQPKRKNGYPHWEQEKVKEGKTEGKLKESKLVKLN